MKKFIRTLIAFMSLFCLFDKTVVAQESKDKPPVIAVAHPLDALTPAEIKTAAELLRTSSAADKQSLFGAITLLEPLKSDVLAWKPGMPIPRQAFAIIRNQGQTSEAVVDLTAGKVVQVTKKPGQHPMIMDRFWIKARDAFMADKRYVAALEKRGLKAGKTIFCTPNSAGYLPEDAYQGRHIVKIPCFTSENKLHPSIARPIEGLMGIVDAETGEVLAVHDREIVALPPAPEGYGDDLTKPDSPLKAVTIAVAGKGNVKISENYKIDWLNWSMRARADKRAGVIISLVKFNDNGKPRDMAYQMNVAEMFVPYMDPNPTWAYRTFMDAGEFGLGYLMSSLQAGVDCPTTANFMDLTFPNDVGGTYTRSKALCVFERPTGDPAWRHYSASRKHVTGQPQTELVVRHTPTLGNYDYVIDYVFSPQGTIKLRIGSTGFDAVKSTAAKDMESPTAEADTAFGSLIASYLIAPNHDHYFSFRLDLDVDGQANTLLQDSFLPTPISNGGRKSLWTVKTQRFLKEGPITTDHTSGGRLLRLSNGKTTNKLKQHPSLWLNAHHDAQSILDLADPPQMRAGFATNQFWVSKLKPDELWSAGLYPNLSTKDEGLPQFVADGEAIADEDIVVWYTMGFRHLTRPEDFPILPTFWHEMTIRPAFFFDRDPSMTFNPGIDRPKQ